MGVCLAFSAQEQQNSLEPEPTDERYKQIIEMESRTIPIEVDGKRHKLVSAAEKILSRSKSDSRCILERGWDQQSCLVISVTKNSLNRALIIADGIVKALEAERFPVTVEGGKHSTTTLIFTQAVQLAITEKVREIGRQEVKEYSSTRTLIEYEGTGILQFRAGDYSSGRKFRDGRKGVLEDLIPHCIGALMREARDQIHWEEQARLREIEDRKRERERAELSRQIAEEEKRVKEFESWVDNWTRARQMRDFIAELEKVWAETNLDLSPDAPKGKRIIWIKQQADRIDPMLPGPPSILDRKREVNYW